jgi:cystathionine beta-lyase
LDDTQAYLDGNRRLLRVLLQDRLPALRWAEPEATYLAWLDCADLGLGDDPAAVFLDRGRVALSSGPGFGTGGRGFARFNLATSRAIVQEAVERMATAVP